MMKAHDTVTIHDLRSLEQAAMEIKRCAERMRSIAASCRKLARAGEPVICVGLSTLAYREVMALMRAGQDFDKYQRQPGRRFTPRALALWASRLFFGGATFQIEHRVFTMPTIKADDERIGVPWKDAVHDHACSVED